MSMTEVRPGVVEIAVDALERSASYAPGKQGRGEWEAVERTGIVRREYDLRALGLASADGRPNDVGKALVELLRSGGKLQRPANDPALLALGNRLSKLIQVDDAPFQFWRGSNVWSAFFEAGRRPTSGPRKKCPARPARLPFSRFNHFGVSPRLKVPCASNRCPHRRVGRVR